MSRLVIDPGLLGRLVRFPLSEEGRIVAVGERDSGVMGIEPYAWILTTSGSVTHRRLDELFFPEEKETA